MLLPREIRVQLQERKTPRIAGEGVCPFKAGDVLEVVKGLTLTVDAVRPTRGGGWSLRYTLTDRRDPARVLKPSPHISAGEFKRIRDGFDEHGYPSEPTPGAIRDAAEESAYTSGFSRLADAGEAVDRETQSAFSKEAQLLDNLREQRRRERWEKRTLLERYQAAMAEARARHIDLSHHERVIADRVDRMERALGKDKAA